MSALVLVPEKFEGKDLTPSSITDSAPVSLLTENAQTDEVSSSARYATLPFG
jgi:hypothetical protein